MIKLNIIDNKENNDNFQLKKYFYQFIIIDNQDIFVVKGEFESQFLINYTKFVFANLTY